jgi:hypothetical protein
MYTKNTSDQWAETRDLRVLDGGSFRRVQKAWVQNAGAWSQFYTYDPTRDTVVTASAPASVTNGPVAVTGSVKDALTGDLVSDVLSVELYNGATKLLTASTSGGNYSFSWSPTAPGSYTLTVKVVTDGYWLASQANTSAITVNTSTSVSVTSWPSFAVIGEAYVVAGTVTPTLTGTAPGTAALQVDDSGTWVTLASATLASGAYSISWTPPAARLGARTLRVRYLGSGNYLASDSASVARTVYQPTPAVPAQTVTALSHTSVTLSITDQANISHFVVKCTETGNTLTTTSTGTAGAAVTQTWGLSANSTYNFTVTAHSNHPTTPTRTGNTITVTTGRPAQTDVGSAAFTFNASSTGSWRSADGWDYLGTRLAQGYYTASYGAYTGVAGFDKAAMRSAVDAYGTDRSGRYAHATCTKFEAYAVRESGGTSAAQAIGWYVSPVAPGSGTTAPEKLSGTTSSPSGLAVGSSGWMTLADARYGDWLLSPTNTSRSVAMYDSGSARYSIYSGGTNFKIRATYSWDWTPVTYVAPTWKSS